MSAPRDPENTSLLMAAVRSGTLPQLVQLLRNCHISDVNAANKHGRTCLVLAAENNRTNMVRTILGRFPTVDMNRADFSDYTALAYAAFKNNFEMCQVLLQAGALPDTRSPSPLYLAVSNNANYDLINLLISRGASANGSNGRGESALVAATKAQGPSVVSLLIQNGATVDTIWYSNTAFCTAVAQDLLEILQSLLNHGVNINYSTFRGETIIHRACCNNSVRFLSHVIDTRPDIDIDARTRSPRLSPAHVAVKGGHVGCLKVLFRAGADCLSPDPHGKTILELALLRKMSDCVVFFVDNPVFPRVTLFNMLSMIRTFDRPGIRSSEADSPPLFISRLLSKWGYESCVDSLYSLCLIQVRRLIGKQPARKVRRLPLPQKVRNAILAYEF